MLAAHRGRGITAEEFDKFRASFLATLDRFTGADPRIRAAWSDLFTPAIEYMVAECARPAPALPAEGVERRAAVRSGVRRAANARAAARRPRRGRS